MALPMVEVFLPQDDATVWEALEAPINSENKIEWFDDLKGWTSKRAVVIVNGIKKECDVFLSSDTLGWVNWREFEQKVA